jgi:hypothetical protein
MKPIILGLILLLIVSLLGVALFYVGTKFLYNVATDISNATTKAHESPKSPDLPTLPQVPTAPIPDQTKPTTLIQPNLLECWSQKGYQGNLIQSVPLNFPIPYSNSGIINIDIRTQSIRYTPGIYDVYYILSAGVPLVNNINNPLSSDTTNITIPNGYQLFILIKNTITTTTRTPTIPMPSNVFRVWTGPNYTGLYKDIKIFGPASWNYNWNYLEPRFNNTPIRSIQIFGKVYSMGKSNLCNFQRDDGNLGNQYDMSKLNDINDDPYCIWYKS